MIRPTPKSRSLHFERVESRTLLATLEGLAAIDASPDYLQEVDQGRTNAPDTEVTIDRHGLSQKTGELQLQLDTARALARTRLAELRSAVDQQSANNDSSARGDTQTPGGVAVQTAVLRSDLQRINFETHDSRRFDTPSLRSASQDLDLEVEGFIRLEPHPIGPPVLPTPSGEGHEESPLPVPGPGEELRAPLAIVFPEPLRDDSPASGEPIDVEQMIRVTAAAQLDSAPDSAVADTGPLRETQPRGVPRGTWARALVHDSLEDRSPNASSNDDVHLHPPKLREETRVEPASQSVPITLPSLPSRSLVAVTDRHVVDRAIYALAAESEPPYEPNSASPRSETSHASRSYVAGMLTVLSLLAIDWSLGHDRGASATVNDAARGRERVGERPKGRV